MLKIWLLFKLYIKIHLDCLFWLIFRKFFDFIRKCIFRIKKKTYQKCDEVWWCREDVTQCCPLEGVCVPGGQQTLRTCLDVNKEIKHKLEIQNRIKNFVQRGEELAFFWRLIIFLLFQWGLSPISPHPPPCIVYTPLNRIFGYFLYAYSKDSICSNG